MELLRSHIERIVDRKPLVNAAMLKEQGINPGRIMGTLIKEAERLAILNDLNDANEVMSGVTEVLAYGTAVIVEPLDGASYRS